MVAKTMRDAADRSVADGDVDRARPQDDGGGHGHGRDRGLTQVPPARHRPDEGEDAEDDDPLASDPVIQSLKLRGRRHALALWGGERRFRAVGKAGSGRRDPRAPISGL